MSTSEESKRVLQRSDRREPKAALRKRAVLATFGHLALQRLRGHGPPCGGSERAYLSFTDSGSANGL